MIGHVIVKTEGLVCMRVFQVLHVGAAAAEAFTTASGGIVVGVTSKGAFLRAENRILFLTELDYRSPFNLQVNRVSELCNLLEPGDKFKFVNNGIDFTGSNLHLDTFSASLWLPPGPVGIISSTAQQLDRSERLLSKINQSNPEKGFLFITRPSGDTLSQFQQKISLAAHALTEAFHREDHDAFMAASIQLVGVGGGLTPSGDDFLAGFFLYHFRKTEAEALHSDFLEGCWRDLVGYSFEKTTTISANRLEYTAKGWSEWLFLELIDYLFNPSAEFTESKIHTLINFGHSSGIDTLVGVDFAIKSLIPGTNKNRSS